MNEAKILVILNSLWNLVNFRKNLIKSLKNNIVIGCPLTTITMKKLKWDVK